MIKIEIKTEKPYEVLIGKAILSGLGGHILSAHKACKVAVVTDNIVDALYLGQTEASLDDAGFAVNSFVIESGERKKTPAVYLSVIDFLASSKLNREDMVVALGGGVVGDIAGFAAATYMRGIDFVQVPTTLLSAIDASVGGKTGVDLAEGKNLLGAFHQPRLVFYDTDTFKTLSPDDIKNGVSEGIKYAVLRGGKVLEHLTAGISDENIADFVAECVKIKRDIVEADEKERGNRRLLNLGHTLGHVIEKLSSFGTPHGQAVAKGLSIVARASNRAGILSDGELNIILDLFAQYGLDISLGYSPHELISHLSLDKKASGDDAVNFVDIIGIGNCVVKKTAFLDLKKYIENL